jgi:MFS family permease
MLGIGVGAIIVPVLAQRLIATFGWRMAYAVLGCAVLFLPLPVITYLLQDDPAQRGLLPDGAQVTPLSLNPKNTQGLSWPEIWHSRTFWLMICVFFLTGASVHATILHMPALLSDRGLSAEKGAIASAVIGLSLTVGRVWSGYLLDRFFAPRIAMLFFGASALGMAILWSGSTGNIALAAGFLAGFGMGAEADIIAYLFGRYFGLRAFGIAYGHAFGAFLLAGALGTLLMGAGFDWTHSYTVPLAACFIAMSSAVAMLMRLGPYCYAVDAEESPQLERGLAPSGA